jgi:3-oxoacyl-(acyl-carrier-protein) synthase
MLQNVSNTELAITVGTLLAGFGLVAGMILLERRPRTSLNPRLIPTTPVMLLGALVAILAIVHLVNLYGVHTGR